MPKTHNPGQDDKHVTPLSVHDDHVVQGLDKGDIAIESHGHQDEYFHTCQQVGGEELGHTVVIGNIYIYIYIHIYIYIYFFFLAAAESLISLATTVEV